MLEISEALDAQIAQDVMGRCPHPHAALKYWTMQSDSGLSCTACGKSDIYGDDCPRYTRYMKDAWQIVEHLRSRGIMLEVGAKPDCYQACYYVPGVHSYQYVQESTGPLAICAAALKAVEAAAARI